MWICSYFLQSSGLFSAKNIFFIQTLNTYWKLDFLTASVCYKQKLCYYTSVKEVFSIPVLHWRDIRAAHTPLHGCRPQTGSVNNASCFISSPPTVFTPAGSWNLALPVGSSVSPPANHPSQSMAPAHYILNHPLAPTQIIKTQTVTLNCY